jgi:peptidoglycan/xylan/chitin deacetylase (PgdA/CDA1 family)
MNGRWTRRAILAFAVCAGLFFVGQVAFRPWLALGILFLSHLLILFSTLVPNCQWWGPVVTRFETKEREVWLTIDDGPDAMHTPRMLALLARFGATATFFTIGKRAEELPNEVARIRQASCEVENHTWSHPSGSFWAFSPEKIGREIDRHPVPSRFFRAPAGLKNFFVHPLLARRKMQLIGWSVRGLDTVSGDPVVVAARIRQGLKPGAIILLHEGHRTESDPEFHPRCLAQTLEILAEEGYRCVIPRLEQLRAGGR